MSAAAPPPGVAGDPRSPIHRLDPRAKLIGLRRGHARRGLHAAARVAGLRRPARARWRGRRARPRRPAHALDPRAGRAPAGALRRRVRAVRPRRRAGRPRPVHVSEEGLETFATVSAKAILGTLSAVLLGATTSFPDVLHALERLKAPKLLVLIAAFMYRYLFMIVDEVRRMRAALAARGYAPRHALQVAGDRPRRHRAVPAHLRARRARAPGDARARLAPDDAAPGRARLHAAPTRSSSPPSPRPCSRSESSHELRHPRPRPALHLPQRRHRPRRLDLHVAHGERVAVLGPNGAGKTTLMLHLNALLTGTRRARGRRPARRPRRRARPARPRRPDLPGPRRPAVHADRARGRRVRPAQPRPLQARGRGPRARRRSTAVRMERARRPRAAPALARPAPARRDRHRAGDATRACSCSTSRRANLDPRTRRELIETLDAIERTMLIVTHDLPLAARAVRARGAAVRGPDRRRRAHARTAAPTSSSWPRTTWSCPKASTCGWYAGDLGPLGLDPVQQLLHRHHERVDALAQQLIGHVVHVDPGVGERLQVGGRDRRRRSRR